ncbi:SDR family NAD(P)-dependent oxidoreductase [Sporosarcina ureilytica]|uniref:Oxidoreductase n=1 Tax=Sporosarcina ureilytica TaxID=298596 RepID=A0A1D8JGG3_9BACL|nr:SDR family NAD(P)-dependent oxidoreductase [Sporosarcina ureilytica]AOV07783.1 oxidoreductase [Sporosarcina ureilytica]
MNKIKTFFITGATSGVGYALAERLLSEGHRVWATGRSIEPLKQLQADGAKIVPADLTNREEMDQLLLTIDTPDVVIFSAGVGTFAYAYEATDDMIVSTMDVNVAVPMQLTRRLLPRMMTQNKGHFIFLGSQAGKVATPKASIYAASKHALIGYTNALRMELAPFDMYVTTIHPGPIDTPFLDLADGSGKYRTSVGRHLLTIQTVVDVIVQVIEKPVREVNLPWYMGITSKVYALMPAFIERVGRKFFFKKD